MTMNLPLGKASILAGNKVVQGRHPKLGEDLACLCCTQETGTRRES